MFRIITFSAIFLLYGCYKAQDKVYDSVYIENIPSNWESAEYQNDYKINDFWPVVLKSMMFCQWCQNQ